MWTLFKSIILILIVVRIYAIDDAQLSRVLCHVKSAISSFMDRNAEIYHYENADKISRNPW